MSVKTEVLKLLEASRERDLSGQEMAESLGVTRSAIWKAVNTLKKEGYQIQAVNNRGYRLKEESDVLSEESGCVCISRTTVRKSRCLSALIPRIWKQRGVH